LGRIIRLDYVGSYELDVPEGTVVSRARLILPDGRVVIQHAKSGTLLTFSKEGTLLTSIEPPKSAYGSSDVIPDFPTLVAAGDGRILARRNKAGPDSKRFVVYGDQEGPAIVDIGSRLLARNHARLGWWAGEMDRLYFLDEKFIVVRTIEYCSPESFSETQRRSLVAIAAGSGGGLAILEDAWAKGSLRSTPQYESTKLYVLDSEGHVRCSFYLPEPAFGVQYDGRSCLLWGKLGEVWLMDIDTGSFAPLEVPMGKDRPMVSTLAFVSEGSEMRAFEERLGDEVSVAKFNIAYESR
jgi:hypothetical protein